MTITVEYFGQLRHVADREQETIEVADGTAVGDALQGVADRYGDAFRLIVFTEDGSFRPSVIVLVNDQPVSKAEPTPLRDGDRVNLLAAIAGG